MTGPRPPGDATGQDLPTRSGWERLGVGLPLVQAPIGGACTPALVAAVGDAGALGMLAGSWLPRAALTDQIRAVQRATARPFGVNLVLEWPQHERLATALDHGVPAISTFWGDPAPYRERIQAAGAVHFHTVGSRAEARAAADLGVDVIVAQGWDAGGHVRGTTATLAFVPAVVDLVSPVPVLAAGGIADARGVRAVLALGARGAWVGTRFLLAEEAGTHPDFRRRLVAATAEDTVHTTVFADGWPDAPHRALRNTTLTRWEAAGRPAAGARPGEHDVIAEHRELGPVRRYADVVPLADHVGDVEAMAMYAGQGVGLATTTEPAASIVADLARGFAAPE
ncbi:nitronate monooxygenase [Saccharothrix tamanrassetensis]|uniref:Nitronate monooxygenase n=1 Tax=Saccharothrix tamanrassetensis TaxID=1051531 RepID=A0A841CCE8_9PSEU|nr:nitronate monooxygenase [Saccharothrix tamanrassetensis]MBB5953848.1 nitronate monooxygenase [Saccharothrix tamanrassetensis]